MISSPNIVGLRTSSPLRDDVDHRPVPIFAVGNVPHAIFDHHDELSTIIPKSIAPRLKQAGRDAEPIHARERKQHRQWNRHRHDHRGSQTAEKCEQHRDDQQPAFEQVVFTVLMTWSTSSVRS